jgi:hypothetical protein
MRRHKGLRLSGVPATERIVSTIRLKAVRTAVKNPIASLANAARHRTAFDPDSNCRWIKVGGNVTLPKKVITPEVQRAASFACVGEDRTQHRADLLTWTSLVRNRGNAALAVALRPVYQASASPTSPGADFIDIRAPRREGICCSLTPKC